MNRRSATLLFRSLIGVACLSAGLAVDGVANASSSFECRHTLPIAQASRIAKRSEEDYQKIASLKARFVQDSFFAGLEKEERSQGTVSFLRPGKMDWNYTSPEPQRFVSDGETLWFYQQTVNQVTVANFRDAFNSELPVSFLLGVGSLSKAFEVKEACQTDRGVLLTLLPKEADPSLSSFRLLVSSKDYRPVGAKVADVGGNETTIELFDLDTTADLQAQNFRFDVPRGVDVVDKRVLSAVDLEPGTVGEESAVTNSQVMEKSLPIN